MQLKDMHQSVGAEIMMLESEGITEENKS